MLGATSVEIVGEQSFVSSPPEYPMPCHAPQAELFDVCAPLGISLGRVLLLAHGSALASAQPGCSCWREAGATRP